MAGKIISLVYESGKNRKILILKNPVDVNDKKFISEIDNAVRFISGHIVEIINDKEENNSDKSINDKDTVSKVGNGEDLDSLRDFMLHYRVDTNNERSDKRVNNKDAIIKVSNDKETNSLQDSVLGHNDDVDKEASGTHEEAEDKMNLLFQKVDDYAGKKIRYLIDINAKKDSGSNKDGDKNKDNLDKKDGDKNKDNLDKKDGDNPRNIILIPEDEVTKTRRTKPSSAYNDYEIAFQHEIPDLVDKIKKGGEIMVKISDIVKELGESFEKKADVSIYTGIRHILYNHGVKVSQCTFKEIDPKTNRGRRGLKMRMFQKGDSIPSSFRRLKEYKK